MYVHRGVLYTQDTCKILPQHQETGLWMGPVKLSSFTASIAHPIHHTVQILVWNPRERMNQGHPGAQESRTASFRLKYLKRQVKTLPIFNLNIF